MKIDEFKKYNNQEVKYIHIDYDDILCGGNILYIDFWTDGEEFTYEDIATIKCSEVSREEAEKIEKNLKSYFSDIIVGYLL